jgi:hypothetical protein
MPRTTCKSNVSRERYASSMNCSCSREALCDRCVEDGFAHLRGVASCRGEVWAARVARETSTSQPWPAHAGRAADIARRKIADLTRDPRLAERLAAELARGAARRWRQGFELGAVLKMSPSRTRISTITHRQFAVSGGSVYADHASAASRSSR